MTEQDPLISGIPESVVPVPPSDSGQLTPPSAPKGLLADLVGSASALKGRLATFKDTLPGRELTPAMVEATMKDVKSLQEDFTELLNIFSAVRKNLAGRLETIRKELARRRKAGE